MTSHNIYYVNSKSGRWNSHADQLVDCGFGRLWLRLVVITRAYCPPAVPGAGVGQLDALAWVGAFDDWLRARGRSANTRRLYLAAVRRWWSYSYAYGCVAGDVAGVLAAWLRVRRGQLSVAAVNVEICGLRAWQDWARQMRPELCIEGLGTIRLRRPPLRVPRYLDAAQVDALIASIPVDTWQGLRDLAIVVVMWDSGLRPSEVAALELGSIRPDGLLFVERGKGGADRYVPASAALMDLLDRWLQRRREARTGKRSALFVTRTGRPLRGAGAVWAILRRYTRAGAGGPSPRWLRAGMATELLRRGCPLPAVADMLGHVRVETTARYTAVDLAQLRAAIDRHPRHRRAPSPAPEPAAAGSDDVG